MTQTIHELMCRKSVRAFTGKPIPAAEKQMILEAAAQAPTAGNQQMYTILDITDPSLKEKLVDTCDHQPFIAQADMVLIFAADCRKWYNAFLAAGCTPRKPGVGDLLLAVTDAAIAAQNAVTAAESLGIGSCYIGDIMENAEAQRALLHLPEYVFPACMLVFGYPAQSQIERKKPERAAMAHIVHENGYRDMEPQELREMLDGKKGVLTYEEWMRRFCERKFNSDFAMEMTRSVQVYLNQFQIPAEKKNE